MTRLALNYNVAGAFEQKVEFLNAGDNPAPRSMDSEMVLSLEDLQVGTRRFYKLFLDG